MCIKPPEIMFHESHYIFTSFQSIDFLVFLQADLIVSLVPLATVAMVPNEGEIREVCGYIPL